MIARLFRHSILSVIAGVAVAAVAAGSCAMPEKLPAPSAGTDEHAGPDGSSAIDSESAMVVVVSSVVVLSSVVVDSSELVLSSSLQAARARLVTASTPTTRLMVLRRAGCVRRSDISVSPWVVESAVPIRVCGVGCGCGSVVHQHHDLVESR